MRGIAAPYKALALLFVISFIAAPVGAAAANNGDVWLDTVNHASGPGHENDPHLSCNDINLWGDNLAGSSGTYTIDGWSPTGSGSGDPGSRSYRQDQAWPGTKAAPGATSWNYDTSTRGVQIISVISVRDLINHAIANGDMPQKNQGFHFKLQLSQDPQKHKVFWVNCPGPPPPVVPESPIAILIPLTGLAIVALFVTRSRSPAGGRLNL